MWRYFINVTYNIYFRSHRDLSALITSTDHTKLPQWTSDDNMDVATEREWTDTLSVCTVVPLYPVIKKFP